MKHRPDKTRRFAQLLTWGLFALIGWATLVAAASVTPTVTTKTQTKAQTKNLTITVAQTTNCTASSATLSMPSNITLSGTLAKGSEIPNSTGTATITFTCVGLPLVTGNYPTDYTATIQAGQYLAPLDPTNVAAGPGITFATNLAGIAVLVKATTVQATSNSGNTSDGPTSTAGYVPGSVTAPNGTAVGTYSGTVTATYTAYLIQTIAPPVSGGTINSINLIPFWWYIPGGSADSTSISLNANLVLPSVTLSGTGCSAVVPPVTLPTVDTNSLSASGVVAGITPFSITLKGCPSGATVATNVFSGGSIDSTTGYLKNSSPNDTVTTAAANVEVQLLNGAGSTNATPMSAIKLNKTTAATQNSGLYNIVGGAVTLNYYAQYIANGGAAGAGNVAASVVYTITYP